MKLLVLTALLLALACATDSSSASTSSLPADYTEVSLSELNTTDSQALKAFTFGVDAVIKIAAAKFNIADLDFSSQASHIYKREKSSAVYYQFEAALVNSGGVTLTTTFTVKCADEGESLYSFKYNIKVPAGESTSTSTEGDYTESSTENNTEVEVEVEIENENEAEIEIETETEIEIEIEIETETEIEIEIETETETETEIEIEIEIETETEIEIETEVEVEVEVETDAETESSTDNNDYVLITGCYSAALKTLIADGAKNVILADSKIPRCAYDITKINSAEKKTGDDCEYYQFDAVLQDSARKNVLRIKFALKVGSDGQGKMSSYKWWYNTNDLTN